MFLHYQLEDFKDLKAGYCNNKFNPIMRSTWPDTR